MSRLNDESEKAKKLNDALIMLADEARVLAFVDEAWGEMRSSAAAAESLTLKLASAADEEYVRLGKQTRRHDEQLLCMLVQALMGVVVDRNEILGSLRLPVLWHIPQPVHA